MRFMQVSGFSVRAGREEEFQRWLAANEERIARAYPEGTEYLGTYASVFTTEKMAGSYRVLERLSCYGDMDRLAALQKDEASDYAKVWREFSRFLDPDPQAAWSQVLLKAATDAAIWDIPPVG